MTKKGGIAGRLAAYFIDSKLTPLFIAVSILAGAGAVFLLPREEEPQIIVPMIDVFVQMPGASPREVASRVTKPMEKLLWEIPGVEYIYSTSSSGTSMTVVRFRVGTKEEDAIVRLNTKLHANTDLIPAGASPPLVKPRSIDDVPILAITLSSERYDHFTLRRLAAHLRNEIKQVTDVSEVTLIGGTRRELRVTLDPARVAAHRLTPASIAAALQQANQQTDSGSFSAADREIVVRTGGFIANAEDAGRIVVSANPSPVYLRDVATIADGPEEPSDYVFAGGHESISPAVTIAVAKRKATNATNLADLVLARVDELKGIAIPSDVTVTVSRNYGETAAEKSNELLFHMLLAIVSVVILIALTLGWRESGIVAIAIPVTLALTLAVFYLLGYTLNRVTLFALIFSIGILVDDAIVVVENIVRHNRLPQNRHRSLR
ncbi:MAG: efflux RND transporter permease subunit, partial [Thermoanaerobaculia bacterium]|nr:efflux RND transporter permease subunit [Thermoanaerobaculia bacterium]